MVHNNKDKWPKDIGYVKPMCRDCGLFPWANFCMCTHKFIERESNISTKVYLLICDRMCGLVLMPQRR